MPYGDPPDLAPFAPTLEPPAQRYCLVSDDDGHHWWCPVERRREAIALLEACEEYFSSEEPPDAEPPPDPDSIEWLQRIDNPTRLTFTEPQEDL